MFRVREFKPEDKEEVANLILDLKKYYPGIKEWLLGSEDEGGKLDQIGEGADEECQVAVLNETITGVCLSSRKGEEIAKISTFYVGEGYRHGYAIGPKLLLQEIQKWKQRGFRYLYVTFASEEFKELMSFFKRYGFQYEGVSPRRYREDSYEIIMGKSLVHETVPQEAFPEFIKKYLFQLRGFEFKNDEGYLKAVPRETKLELKEISQKRTYSVDISTVREKEGINRRITRLENIASETSCFISFYGVPSEIKEEADCLIYDAYDIETLFYPVHLMKIDQKPVMIPIKREFADQLFPRESQATLTPSEVASRTRNVYYKYPSGFQKIAPGTNILWYVSGEEGKIRGEAKLKAFKVDSPRDLWEKYGDVGVFEREDIEASTDGNQAMAIVFDWYEEYLNPVSLEEVQVSPPQTLVTVDEEKFQRIRNIGFSPS